MRDELTWAPADMSDVATTAANVLASDQNDGIFRGVAGAAIAAGDVIARDTGNNNVIILADANGSAVAKVVAGVAVNSAPGAGQPVDYVNEDPNFNPGGTIVEGKPYVLSATPGKMCPADDLAAGMALTVLGAGKANNKLNLKLIPGGTVQ